LHQKNTKIKKRKNSEAIPYINHVVETARLLTEEGNIFEPEVIIAAILHVTIEDTDTTPHELESLFGAKVKNLVLELTDDKLLPKAERKKLQIENARHKSINAKLIKICDKIANIKDIINNPPENWSDERRREYLDWAEKVVNGLKGTNEKLEKLFYETLVFCREKLR
jgi:(p)ppGpp synthase/HD superfamily hydrolase